MNVAQEVLNTACPFFVDILSELSSTDSNNLVGLGERSVFFISIILTCKNQAKCGGNRKFGIEFLM